MNSQKGFGNADPPLCSGGCGFFGTAANQNLCSRCYMDFLKEKARHATAAPAAPASSFDDTIASRAELSLQSETTEKPINGGSSKKMKTNRCDKCSKKVGLLGFKCRCGSMFCGEHRMPEKHECGFDYKAMGREILRKQNPFIRADKLEPM